MKCDKCGSENIKNATIVVCKDCGNQNKHKIFRGKAGVSGGGKVL